MYVTTKACFFFCFFLLKEQHAVNGLFRHAEKIIILMSFTAAATESWEMFNLLCRETDFCIFFPPFYPQWDPFQTQHRAALRLAEPLLGHPNLNAALQTCQQSLWWGNLTWHFSNPVHCRLPFQLSRTVIEHHIANLKRSCGDSGRGHVQCFYTAGIKLKGLKWLKGSSLQWLLWYRDWLITAFLSQPISRNCIHLYL